jgi:hypothetical protein
MWKAYQQVIAEIDAAIDAHLKSMRKAGLPALPPRSRKGGVVDH